MYYCLCELLGHNNYLHFQSKIVVFFKAQNLCWVSNMYCNPTVVLLLEATWRSVLGSTYCHTKVGKLCLNTYIRQQNARWRGEREEGGLGTRPHNSWFIAWLKRIFFQLWHNRTAPGYRFCDAEVLYWNIGLWHNRTVSGYCPVT